MTRMRLGRVRVDFVCANRAKAAARTHNSLFARLGNQNFHMTRVRHVRARVDALLGKGRARVKDASAWWGLCAQHSSSPTPILLIHACACLTRPRGVPKSPMTRTRQGRVRVTMFVPKAHFMRHSRATLCNFYFFSHPHRTRTRH